MNTITKALLGGAALCALATASAVAEDVADFRVTAMHAGNVIDKTVSHHPGREHLTYTFGVSSYIQAQLDKTVKLPNTGYSWGCTSSTKGKITKKPIYGKAGFYTETNSTACNGAGEVFYGNTYKLTNPEGEGKIDNFVSSLIGKYQKNGVKYQGKLNLDVTLGLGE